MTGTPLGDNRKDWNDVVFFLFLMEINNANRLLFRSLVLMSLTHQNDG